MLGYAEICCNGSAGPCGFHNRALHGHLYGAAMGKQGHQKLATAMGFRARRTIDTPQLWGEWGYRAATLMHLDPWTLGLPGREPTPWGWIAVGRAGRLR